jgi:ribonuclease Z
MGPVDARRGQRQIAGIRRRPRLRGPLDQIGVKLTDLHTVFLTHFHFDHVNGLADLWLMRFLFANRFKLDSPLRLCGPMGTSELAENLEKAFSADIRIRHADENAPLAAAKFKCRNSRRTA